MNYQLIKWAERNNIPTQALAELADLWRNVNDQPVINPKTHSPATETFVSDTVRLEASKRGGRLWRNNVGAYDPNRPPAGYMRWGLCNDSPEINAVCKSSDLIGIMPILITADMVGKTIGQFTARETKKATWKPGEDKKREDAQQNFINLVNLLGGDAKFTNGEF